MRVIMYMDAVVVVIMRAAHLVSLLQADPLSVRHTVVRVQHELCTRALFVMSTSCFPPFEVVLQGVAVHARCQFVPCSTVGHHRGSGAGAASLARCCDD